MTTGEPYSEPQGNTDLPPGYMQDDSDAGNSTSQQLASKARQGVDQVKQTASDATDQVKQTAMSQAASQKEQAAQSLDTVGKAVNQAARQLRRNNQAPIAQVAETAASNINQFANYLLSRSVNDMIGEVEDFASNQPALFLGGAFLLGVLGARFLKSSRAGMSSPSGRQGGSQGRGQQWSGRQSQGSQYSSYSGMGASSYGTSMPGTGDNINTGGLEYGRNLPTDGSD